MMPAPKTKKIIFGAVLVLSIFFLFHQANAFNVGSNIHFSIPEIHTTYTTNTSFDFSHIEFDSVNHSIYFNNSIMKHVTYGGGSAEIFLDIYNLPHIKYYVVTSGTVTGINATIGGFTPGSKYTIKVDGTLWKIVTANAQGEINFNYTSWSNHTFEITAGELSWHTISLWSGNVYSTAVWSAISIFVGSITNISSWKEIESWQGSIYNTSSWATIESWQGSVYNLSQWNIIESWDGAVYNTSQWYEIESWVGDVYNHSEWIQIEQWNGKIVNLSSWNVINQWFENVYNNSVWNTINEWAGSLCNQSTWNLVSQWSGGIHNVTGWNIITQWSGNVKNISQWNDIEIWIGDIVNTSIWNNIESWNGSLFNISSWKLINQWDGYVVNNSAWYQIEQWNASLYNTSEYGWIDIETWNGNVRNLSSWNTVSTWDGLVTNISKWNDIEMWDGTLYTLNQWNTINIWNEIIYNISTYNVIEQWIGNITNSSIWNTIEEWNGTVQSTLSWYDIETWAGNIFNYSTVSGISIFVLSVGHNYVLGDTALCSAILQYDNGSMVTNATILYKIYKGGVTLYSSGVFTNNGDGTYYFTYKPPETGNYLIYADASNLIRTEVFKVSENYSSIVNGLNNSVLIANFDYHNFANGSIQFIDTSLSSSQIINWTWNISNTTYYTQNPVVAFDKRQTINVTLTITDVYNNTNSTSKNVTVYIKSFTPYQFVVFISVLSLLSMFTSIYIFRKEEDENLRKLGMTKSLIFAMLSGIGWIITSAISISIGIPYEVVYRNVVISDWNVVTSNSIPIFFFGIGIVCIVWTVYLIMDILRTSVPSSHPAYTKWFRWKR